MDERVFISYSSEDMQWAQLIKDNLEANGISCWMANSGGIAPGEDYIEEISRALEGCSVFVLVLSENAEKSVWVAKELGTAITGRKKIIPVKISSYQISRFRFQLENIQVFEPGNLQEMASQINLVNAVKKALNLKEASESPVASQQAPPVLPAGEGKKTGGSASGADPKKLVIPLAVCIVVIVAVVAFRMGRNGAESPSADPAEQTAQDTGMQDMEEQAAQDTGMQDMEDQTAQDTGMQDMEEQAAQDAGMQDMEDQTAQDAGMQDIEGQTAQDTDMQSMGDQQEYGYVSHLEDALLAEQNDERFYYDGDYLDVGICSWDGEMASITLTAPEDGYYFFEMRICEWSSRGEFRLNSELPFLPDVSVLPGPFGRDNNYFCAVAYLEAGDYTLETNSQRCNPRLTPVTVRDDPFQFAEVGEVYVYFLDEPRPVDLTYTESLSGNFYYYGGGGEGEFLNLLDTRIEGNLISVNFPAGVVVSDLRYLW